MRVTVLALAVAVVLAPVGGATAIPSAGQSGGPTALATTSSGANVSLTAYALDNSIQAGSNATSVGDGEVRKNITIDVSGGTVCSDGVLQEGESGGIPSGACYYTEDYDKDLLEEPHEVTMFQFAEYEAEHLPKMLEELGRRGEWPVGG